MLALEKNRAAVPRLYNSRMGVLKNITHHIIAALVCGILFPRSFISKAAMGFSLSLQSWWTRAREVHARRAKNEK